MKNTIVTKLSLVALMILSVSSLTGCYGLAVGQLGMHYQTEKADGLDNMKFKKIGVYALSDGKAKSIKEVSMGSFGPGMWPFMLVPFPYTAALISRPNTTDAFGFTPSNFPDKIEIPFKVRTDSANAGPSFELALAMQKELEERGYTSEAATDAPHRGVVTSDGILTHAKAAGYDAAVVMVYTVFNRWQQLRGIETSTTFNTRTTTINVNYTEGYLIIPSVALVDVATGRMLWNSAYYGLVSGAHSPNVSNQALSIAVNDVLVEQGRTTYVDAAKVSVDRVFNPKHWKGSYKPFPAPKTRKPGEKFDF
jgi:hypothetical protein